MRLNAVISRIESRIARVCVRVRVYCVAGRHWKAGEELNFDACRGCNVIFMACDQGH